MANTLRMPQLRVGHHHVTHACEGQGGGGGHVARAAVGVMGRKPFAGSSLAIQALRPRALDGRRPTCTCAVEQETPGGPLRSLDVIRQKFDGKDGARERFGKPPPLMEKKPPQRPRGSSRGSSAPGSPKAGSFTGDAREQRSGDELAGKLEQVSKALGDAQAKEADAAKQMLEMRGLMRTAAENLKELKKKQDALEKKARDQEARERSRIARGEGAKGEDEDESVLVTDPFAGDGVDSDCFSEHPGIMCCTRSKMDIDDRERKAVITMETSVALGGASRVHVDHDEFVAIAAKALAESAEELSRRELEKVHGCESTTARSHAEIVNVLQHGDIIAAKPNDLHVSAFGHESFLVELQDPGTNKKINALFKPRVEGDAEGWHRAPIEWVAYELNLMLGLDLVPPVAYRTGGVDVDYRHFEEGAFIYFVKGASELRSNDRSEWGQDINTLMSDTRILDVLLHNSDRHHGHFLLGEHWVRGSVWEDGQWQGHQGPVLIDHAAGFRDEAFVSMTHQNAFQTGPVKCVHARTYMRLRFLDAQALANKFTGVLSEGEMRALLARRNSILEYLDNLVHEQGYDETVYE